MSCQLTSNRFLLKVAVFAVFKLKMTFLVAPLRAGRVRSRSIVENYGVSRPLGGDHRTIGPETSIFVAPSWQRLVAAAPQIAVAAPWTALRCVSAHTQRPSAVQASPPAVRQAKSRQISAEHELIQELERKAESWRRKV